MVLKPNNITKPDFVFGWRSDTRPLEDIFEIGFQSIVPNEPVTINKKSLDIESRTAVCFTSIFDAAAIFPTNAVDREKGNVKKTTSDIPPLRHYPKYTNIYLVKVPRSEVFFTYLTQIDKKCNLAFIQEMAVKEIPPEFVFGAVSIKRFFYTSISDLLDLTQIKPKNYSNFCNGGEFVLESPDFTFNQKSQNKISKMERQKINDLIAQRVHRAIKIPTPLNLNYKREELYTLKNQPPSNTFSLYEHKAHKRLTYAIILLVCSTLSKEVVQFDSKKISAKIDHKTKDLMATKFPVLQELTPKKINWVPRFLETTLGEFASKLQKVRPIPSTITTLLKNNSEQPKKPKPSKKIASKD